MNLKRRDFFAAGASAVAVATLSSGIAAQPAAASGVRILVSPEQLRPAYAYIIVGAGSAGCVLAHRLARTGRRVLLVEAGGPANLPAIADPPDWPKLQGGEVDWRYSTIPQPGLGGRIVPYPRGKVVGDRVPSTLSPISGATLPHTIAGQRGGAMLTSCHISSAQRRFLVERALGEAATVLCMYSHSPT